MTVVRKALTGVKKDAPLWMQYTNAIMVILLASKPALLNIPGINEASKTLVGLWFDYITNCLAVAFAITSIFSGKSVKINKLNVLLFMAFISMFMSSCYTEKTARKDVVKAQAIHPEVVQELFGNWYKPVQKIKDSIVYIQGQTVYTTDTVTVDCDTVKGTVTRVVKLPCPPCESRVDTFYTSKETTEHNDALEQSLARTVKAHEATITRQSTKLTMLWWAVGILGVYTIVRWVLKYFTGFSLP